VNARSSDVNTRAQALLDGSGWVNLENLGKQLSECDEALIVYQKAIELGEQELQAILGQVSAELCLERRPEFASEIQKILAALKAIDESNSALERIRDEMEREGISTGSLPWGCFDMGGRWDDQFGGRVVGYQRYVSEFYPECSGNSH
jgi:hypothetical protein